MAVLPKVGGFTSHLITAVTVTSRYAGCPGGRKRLSGAADAATRPPTACSLIDHEACLMVACVCIRCRSMPGRLLDTRFAPRLGHGLCSSAADAARQLCRCARSLARMCGVCRVKARLAGAFRRCFCVLRLPRARRLRRCARPERRRDRRRAPCGQTSRVPRVPGDRSVPTKREGAAAAISRLSKAIARCTGCMGRTGSSGCHLRAFKSAHPCSPHRTVRMLPEGSYLGPSCICTPRPFVVVSGQDRPYPVELPN